MSEAVRAAIRAARQQQARDRASSPTKGHSAGRGGDIGGGVGAVDNPFARTDFMAAGYGAAQVAALGQGVDELGFVQASVDSLLNKACQNGRLNLSSRSPALTKLPPSVFSLTDDDAPAWFSAAAGLQWWERQELRVLIAANGELDEVDERIAAFRALVTLDLHNNRLPSLPSTLFQLKNITTVSLSHNKLTTWPQALLALDNLVTLDLSHNALASLWDDGMVERARDQREQWDQQQADEEHQGIWATLGRDLAKERREKEAAAALAARWPRAAPLRALKTLNLSSNRLGNDALGVATSSQAKVLTWPPNLERLELNDNALRSPIVLRSGNGALAQLPALRELGLAGNPLSDEVFRVDESGALTGFASLLILDVGRCEIDDLARLEETFDARFDAPAADQHDGRQLVRIKDRAAASASSNPKRLHVLLEGNPLREEIFKQKRGLRSIPGTSHTGVAAKETANVTPSSTSSTVAVDRRPDEASPPKAAAPSPAKKQPVKEKWEVEAEAGMLTEGQRRLARIQAARKAEEEAAAAAAGSSAEGSNKTTPSTSSSAGQASNSRPAKTGVNKTGLSDWDGEPVLPKYLQRRQMPRGTSDDSSLPAFDASSEVVERDAPAGSMDEATAATQGSGAGAGSTLANAKLSVKKKEALGQVPCKFFRSNGCSAGAACPFAHTTPGDGHQKAVCAYWAKGQCKFGHRCALLHILPGQPVSMDRKNKRAAHQAQTSGAPPEGSAQAGRLDGRPQHRQHSKTNTASLQSYPPPPTPSQQVSQHAPFAMPIFHHPSSSNTQPASSEVVPWLAGMPPPAAAALLASLHSGSAGAGAAAGPAPRPHPSSQRPATQHYETDGMDMPFGMPDDLQHLAAPSTSRAGPIAFPVMGGASGTSTHQPYEAGSDRQFQPARPIDDYALSPPAGASQDLFGRSPNFSHAHVAGSSARSTATTTSAPMPTAASATRPLSVSFSRQSGDDPAHSFHNAHALSGSPSVNGGAGMGMFGTGGIGPPAPAPASASASSSRIFGTSPFSHPAGTSVFYSASQGDGVVHAGGAEGRRLGAGGVQGAARSMSRLEELGRGGGHDGWARAAAPSAAAQDASLLDDGEGDNGEGFLPSSLSDLLTPAELEQRRKRSTSQTAGQRPLSFVGYATLQAHSLAHPHAHASPQDRHRHGQLSASSTSRLGGAVGAAAAPTSDAPSHSPSASARWPAGLDSAHLSHSLVDGAPPPPFSVQSSFEQRPSASPSLRTAAAAAGDAGGSHALGTSPLHGLEGGAGGRVTALSGAPPLSAAVAERLLSRGMASASSHQAQATRSLPQSLITGGHHGGGLALCGPPKPVGAGFGVGAREAGLLGEDVIGGGILASTALGTPSFGAETASAASAAHRASPWLALGSSTTRSSPSAGAGLSAFTATTGSGLMTRQAAHLHEGGLAFHATTSSSSNPSHHHQHHLADELGPVAPSSILPHRPSPLSLAGAAASTSASASASASAAASVAASASASASSVIGSEPGTAPKSVDGSPATRPLRVGGRDGERDRDGDGAILMGGGVLKGEEDEEPMFELE